MHFACKISLRRPWRALLFLLLAGAPLCWFAAEIARISLAESWGRSGEAGRVRRAITLDPQNAEYHYRLGMISVSDLVADPSQALTELRKATELNPRRAEYWLGLARGCLLAGDGACSRRALETAIRAAPMNPSFEQEAASYYAATGEGDRMLAHLRRLLELSAAQPGLRAQVFELSWRAVDDPKRVWEMLIGPARNVAAKCEYLDFLASKRRFDLTGQYWAATADGTMSISFGLVQPFLQHLLEAQQYEQAAVVWRDLLRMRVIPSGAGFCAAEADAGNLVFNGCFAQPPLNTGFDWQSRETEFVALDVSGHEGLRVEFTVPHNATDEPLFQLIAVQPNQAYLLRARTRSEAITSDSGPRLRIVDLRCPACLDLATGASVGSTPWHRVQLAFSTGPQTRFLSLSVWRPRSRSFPMDISGRAWFDEISLHELKSQR